MEGSDLQLGLADVDAKLTPVVEELGFTHVGALFVKRFPAGSEYWEKASARFEFTAEEMVLQAARLAPIRWESTLELVCDRGAGIDWSLVGSAARAVRGEDVQPRDVDLVADAAGCDRLAAALADLLVEPLADGGWLGARWFRAFGHARVECVGGIHAPVAERFEIVVWRGHKLRVGVA